MPDSGKSRGHIPVLASPAIEYLRIRPDGAYVDCTLGGAGHAALIAQRLTSGRLIGLDRDPAAIEGAQWLLRTGANVTLVHANYANLARTLAGLKIESVDGVLIDAGLSSLQLDDPQRGLTFQQEGPLDMRLDPTQSETAATLLTRISQDELIPILREYGNVRPARRIARAILARRDAGRLETTRDLAAAISEGLGVHRGPPEETRQVFQAIRIAVNSELKSLEAGLRQAIEVLAPGGRLVAISFHSGEDRIVKNCLREASRPRRQLTPDGRVTHITPPVLKILTPKPVQPDKKECEINPRSRSARLRAAERLT